MKEKTASIIHSGSHTSPETPNYSDDNVGETPQTWSSERVPLPTRVSSRRHVSAAALMPFNTGRALPSKWDDAERWITSPVSAHGSANASSIAQPHRRPKSKSGPLVPPGFVSSPTKHAPEGGNVRNLMVNSLLAAGVLVPDGLSIRYDAAKSNSFCAENNVKQTIGSLGPSSRDDKVDETIEEEARAVESRDKATQMSPEGSTHLSSKGRSSFSALPSSRPNPSSPQINPVAKDEVRDVQVDKGTTTCRPSKKQQPKKSKKDPNNVLDSSVPCNASESLKNASKFQREEGKIVAWENLQKAKAEAAIQKLEMKLEKKRLASMDNIMNKLRDAETKAQAMRDSLSENNAPRASRARRMGFSCRKFEVNSVSNCLLCRRN